MGLKFRSPIYWEYKFNGALSVLCYKCGERYSTTFKKYKVNKACPKCKYKLADNI